ncbi:MAG TPA: DUF134 domain-containing protein, partial [Anaerolineales bacterium]|nr:DUF134 domain-containing protein [Anaerolineales bacterium]
MPRPRKRRRVARLPRPDALIYKPAGIPLERLSRVSLLAEELEALRLADLEGMDQVQAAERMAISRSTFQRILARARRQVALALVEGNALEVKIENGSPAHEADH